MSLLLSNFILSYRRGSKKDSSVLKIEKEKGGNSLRLHDFDTSHDEKKKEKKKPGSTNTHRVK